MVIVEKTKTFNRSDGKGIIVFKNTLRREPGDKPGAIAAKRRELGITSNRRSINRRSNTNRQSTPPITMKPKLASPTEFGLRTFNKRNNNRTIPKQSSFTVATPIGRNKEKLVIQDINFRFRNKRLMDVKRHRDSFIMDELEFQRRSRVSPLSNIHRAMGPIPL